MPLKLSIKIGDNLFGADGDFEFNAELTSIFRVWVAALGGEAGVNLEQITEQIEGNTQQLADAVAASTPGATP